MRQHGIALVTAILVVALAAIAATAILTSANIAIHRASNLQDSERAWWYADGVESWVKSILERDREDNKIDSLRDAWAKPVDYLPVDQGFVKGSVIDLQGRFNVNTLAGKPQQVKDAERIFTRLLHNVDENIDEFRARALVAAIRDWIDADSEPTGMDGAEDTAYLQADETHLPYRTPNRPMESVSELLAVRGMTKELYARLMHCADIGGVPQPCICALPQTDTPINLNTAPEPLLMALTNAPGHELAEFVRDRVDKPAESPGFAWGASGFIKGGDLQRPQGWIGVSSHWFMLRAQATIGAGRVSLFSTYYRPDSGKAAMIGHSTDLE